MTSPTLPLDQLESELEGILLRPDDSAYDEARTVFYGGHDRHPAAIARVVNATDAATVVNFARSKEVELAVRSGGHSVAGHSVTEGGIVLDLGKLKDLEFDVEGQTAWASSGLTALEYTTAAAEHGLVTGFGDTGSVGLGGLTLGGGVGYLVRKFGLTIDDLLAAEVVTADGDLLRASDADHPDLFWALRGGGGNFGVVTRFQYRLHPLTTLVGGLLILPATGENLLAFLEAADAAPDELSTIANVMNAPPMPFLPEKVQGKLIIMGMVVYAGRGDAAERAVAPFRSIASPIADLIEEMPVSGIYPPDDPEFHPIAAARTMFVDEVDSQGAEAIVQRLRASTAMMAVTQVRVLGGALARVSKDATAFAHRERRLMVNVAALFERPEQAPEYWPWVDDLAAALQRGEPGAYVGFLGSEGEARDRQAYPGETWNRLVAVKRRYDPTNLFRLNINIPSE